MSLVESTKHNGRYGVVQALDGEEGVSVAMVRTGASLAGWHNMGSKIFALPRTISRHQLRPVCRKVRTGCMIEGMEVRVFPHIKRLSATRYVRSGINYKWWGASRSINVSIMPDGPVSEITADWLYAPVYHLSVHVGQEVWVREAFRTRLVSGVVEKVLADGEVMVGYGSTPWQSPARSPFPIGELALMRSSPFGNLLSLPDMIEPATVLDSPPQLSDKWSSQDLLVLPTTSAG